MQGSQYKVPEDAELLSSHSSVARGGLQIHENGLYKSIAILTELLFPKRCVSVEQRLCHVSTISALIDYIGVIRKGYYQSILNYFEQQAALL